MKKQTVGVIVLSFFMGAVPTITQGEEISSPSNQSIDNSQLQLVIQLETGIKENISILNDLQSQISHLKTEIEKKNKTSDKLHDVNEKIKESVSHIQEKNTITRYFNYVFQSNADTNIFKRIVHGITVVKNENSIQKEYEQNEDNLTKILQELETLESKLELLEVEASGNLDLINQQKEEYNFLLEELKLEGKAEILGNETSQPSVDRSIGDYDGGRFKSFDVPIMDGNFTFPTIGEVTQTYGTRSGKLETGITIKHESKEVTPILAVAEGIVTASDFSDIQGNIISIKHSINGMEFISTYSHLGTRAIKLGDRVKKGSFIGTMGNTGITEEDQDHLYFQLRKIEKDRTKIVNPLLYIPVPSN